MPDKDDDITIDADLGIADLPTAVQVAIATDTPKTGRNDPPAAFRFKPGQSGNPRGRPKKPIEIEKPDEIVEVLKAGTAKERSAALRDIILDAGRIKGDLLAGKPMPKKLGGLTRLLVETASGKELSSYLTLLGKVLPTTLAGDKDNPLQTQTKLADEDYAIMQRFISEKNKDVKAKAKAEKEAAEVASGQPNNVVDLPKLTVVE